MARPTAHGCPRPSGTASNGRRVADAIVVGAGLAGLVAVHELTSRGKKVAVLDQENEANLGGQAFWSFGGLFLVDSPEQRRLGIKDSAELAWNDWQGSAGFDRLDDEDVWAVQWARAYVDFAAAKSGPGASRTASSSCPPSGGPNGRPACRRTRELRAAIPCGLGHRDGRGRTILNSALDAAKEAWSPSTTVIGSTIGHQRRESDRRARRGACPDDGDRGVRSNRNVLGDFELSAQAVIVTTGGIGGNHEIVRQYWPERMGSAPKSMITGVPAYVDGRMLDIAAESGVRLVNRDRMWHYTEGVQNWDPIWPGHAIRILPGPSSMWFDALGKRLPQPYLPGYDTLGTLRYLRTTPEISGYDHSWFILTQKIIEGNSRCRDRAEPGYHQQGTAGPF